MTTGQLKPVGEQVVVLMGASSGIGRESAARFARRGAKVVVSARGEEGLASLVEEIRALGSVVSTRPTSIRPRTSNRPTTRAAPSGRCRPSSPRSASPSGSSASRCGRTGPRVERCDGTVRARPRRDRTPDGPPGQALHAALWTSGGRHRRRPVGASPDGRGGGSWTVGNAGAKMGQVRRGRRHFRGARRRVGLPLPPCPRCLECAGKIAPMSPHSTGQTIKTASLVPSGAGSHRRPPREG